MGKIYSEITSHLQTFIEHQRMFFVATAPSGPKGHVNCSPKGFDSFRILGPTTVGYLDLTGSGAETIAHLRDNGRMVIMFCAFDGPPNIVRLYGTGRTVEPHDPEFSKLAPHFPTTPGTRAIIVLEITRITDSCGYGVPVYEYKEERTQYAAWFKKKNGDEVAAYQREKNAVSIDGLPALRFADSQGDPT